MMNFSMSGKRRMPVGFQNRMQVMKQVPKVPVVAHVVVPVIVHESNEIGENVNNSEENKIVYTIGEEENHVVECVSVPEPVLEEPVIETLSNPEEKKHEEEKHAEEENHVEEDKHEEEENHVEEEKHEEEENHAEEEKHEEEENAEEV